jgi:hypothetical protein
LGKRVKEDFPLLFDSFAFERLKLVIAYFMNLDIQLTFLAAFGTDKKPCSMHAPFNLFSAELTVAMQTNMNM